MTRHRLGGVLVSNIWWEDRIDPRRVFRPTMNRFGPGSHLTMPLAASWMSSSPTTAVDAPGNIVVFPRDVDKTFIAFMQKLGVLGAHTFANFHELPDVARREGKKIYSVDDLPEEWDEFVANRSATHRLVNAKQYLRPLSAWAAEYELADLDTTTAADFERIGGGKRVYVKLCNTENTGDGVRPVDTAEQYLALVTGLKTQADAYGLSRQIVLQPSITGRNNSFQFVMRPGESRLGLIALSNQRVADDGVTYAGSENLPLTPAALNPEITAMMTDMAARIRAIDPEAFGCVMCDYFTLEDCRLVTFDPGLRPTGNTATSLARMFTEEQLQSGPLVSEFFFVPVQPAERDFDTFQKPMESITGVNSVAAQGYGVLPWGYNQYMGRGPLIAVAVTREKLQEAIGEATGMLMTAHG